MTPREVINSPSVRVIVYAVLIGIAWGEMRVSVGQKADRSEMMVLRQALSDSVKMADSEQMTLIAGMANDIKNSAKDMNVIKLILCQQAQRDSYCHGP